ncbi:MAG: LysM peptidoglycan-binding domain-containing protein [Thermodesulfobacteriota bacterium]
MNRGISAGVFSIVFLFVFFISFPAQALTPPARPGAKIPPQPELILEPVNQNAQTPTPRYKTLAPSDLPSNEEAEQDRSSNEIIKPSSEEIKKKVILELKDLEKKGDEKTQATFDFPIVINDQVEYFIDYFQSKMPKRFSLWMGRSTRYMSMMKKILREHDLPEDLIYLAMIESGFSTKAYSRAHAVGPWQFIRETGERYGLRVTSWVDERKDPIKSTQAAARHLVDLYNRFGSWYLAAAAYNAGEGKISRALSMYNATNFWEITADHCSYIKEETKQYVPKMIAAALIAKEPEKYGFRPIHYQAPLAFDEVTVPGNVELKEVASLLEVDVDVIVDLNPELKRWITPPGQSEYTLRIPEGTRGKLLENYAQLFKSKPKIIYAEHRVKKGERLASISRRYGVQSGTIARVNRISVKRRLTPGLVLLIPKKTGGHGSFSEQDLIDESAAENGNRAKAKQSSARKNAEGNKNHILKKDQAISVRYKIKKGDSLARIAEKFDIDSSLIKQWNPTKGGLKIQPGKALTLYLNKTDSIAEEIQPKARSLKGQVKKTKSQTEKRIKLVHYTVRKGDSLSEIAQKFNTTPNQIRNWNRLSAKEHIKPGDRLKLKKTALENI